MLNLLQNFILFDPQNASLVVWLGCGGIWLIVALVLAGDVIYSPVTPLGSKIAWLLILLVLPVVGGVFYALACLLKSDWSSLGGLRRTKHQPARKGAARALESPLQNDGPRHPAA